MQQTMNDNTAMTESTEQDVEKKHYMEVRYALLEYSAYTEEAVLGMQNRLDKFYQEHPRQAKMLSSELSSR